MFHEGDLQSGIALAVQQSKAVLCFVHGNSQKSKDWEDVLAHDEAIHDAVANSAICLRLKVVSRETQFLSSFCPIKTTPAIVVIRNGTLQLNLQSEETTTDQLKQRLRAAFPGATTRQNVIGSVTNAVPPQRPQPPVSSIPIPPPASSTSNDGPVSRSSQSIATSASPVQQTEPTPSDGPGRVASGSLDTDPPDPQPNREPQLETTRTTAPPTRSQQEANDSSRSQQSEQRESYVKMQKEREQKQRDERERIKQQIKSDREERRRIEQIRKQTETASTTEKEGTPTLAKSKDIRVQVRMFDGSTLRQTFPQSANISKDVRSWIDSSSQQSLPYNLKLILTPLPNRNIEAGEEEQCLTDLGIKGSCTFIMVPVKGYVDSYAEVAPSLAGTAVAGGYNLVTSTAGAVFGGFKSVLGFGKGTASPQAPAEADNSEDPSTSAPKVRVRTLADQRAEESKKDQQFYNGNQLNFQPRKDEDDVKKD